MEAHIRPAAGADLARINEIYNAQIVGSHVSFDVEPWTDEERAEWWERYRGRVLVATDANGVVIGTAFAGPWRHKEAYRSSVETTVVLDEGAVGKGIGSALLGALLEHLAAEGVHRAYAIIALPNDASVAVHRRLGYREVGILDEVGQKLGRYWSTLIMERSLSSDGAASVP